MAQVDREFSELLEHHEGTLTAHTAGFWNRLAVPLAASRGDASLAKLANSLEASPRRMAGLVTRLEDYDPVALAALAGKRSLQDLSGVTPEGGRSNAPPTMLEVVAREASERHWERSRTEPEAAKRSEQRWAGQRARLRVGHLSEALEAVEATYGTACSAERQAAMGRRVTTAPPQGYRPQGDHALPGIATQRWKKLTDEAVVRTRLPSDWKFKAQSQAKDKPRLLYYARGAGRAQQLAAARFSPRVAFSRVVFKARLKRALRRGPVATQRFLKGVASSPRRTAAALASRLDPMIVAAAIGAPAMNSMLRGERKSHPGPLGKLHAALETRDYATLGAVALDKSGNRPSGVSSRQYHAAVSGGLQGDPKVRVLADEMANRVWTGAQGRPSGANRTAGGDLQAELTQGQHKGNVYDAWRDRRTSVAQGMTKPELDARFASQEPALVASRDQFARETPRPRFGEGTTGYRPGTNDAADRGAEATARAVPAPPPLPREVPTAHSDKSEPLPAPSRADSVEPQSPSPAAADSYEQLPPRGSSVPDTPPSASPAPSSVGAPRVPVDADVVGSAPSSPASETRPDARAEPVPAKPVRPKSALDEEESPVPDGPGALPSKSAVITIPPDALTKAHFKTKDLPEVRRQDDGSWKVIDDPFVDRVVERKDGGYDVYLKPEVSASITPLEPHAGMVASGVHMKRTEPELVRANNADTEHSYAALQKASVDSMAVAVEQGRSSFDLPRDNFTPSLAHNPVDGLAYEGLDGQVLRTRAAELDSPDDARFATEQQIVDAGGSLAEGAEGVVVMREVPVESQPFGENGKLDMDAAPVEFKVTTPVVLYHVEAQTDVSPSFEKARHPNPADLGLEPKDLALASGVTITHDEGEPTGYRPAQVLAGGDGRASAVRPEVINQGSENVHVQRSQMLVAAVDSAFEVSKDGRAGPPAPAAGVYTVAAGKDASKDAVSTLEAEHKFVKACVVDRVASRIGAGYSPQKPLDDSTRQEFSKILRNPQKLDRLSTEADRVTDWVVDGAKDRLQDRGMATEHTRRDDAQGRGPGADSPDRAQQPAQQR